MSQPLKPLAGHRLLKAGEYCQKGDIKYSNYLGEYVPVSDWELEHMPQVTLYDFILRPNNDQGDV